MIRAWKKGMWKALVGNIHIIMCIMSIITPNYTKQIQNQNFHFHFLFYINNFLEEEMKYCYSFFFLVKIKHKTGLVKNLTSLYTK